jgi:WD40 repeat protein
VLSASADGTLRVWDVRAGGSRGCLATLTGHRGGEKNAFLAYTTLCVLFLELCVLALAGRPSSSSILFTLSSCFA